ncbi:MAG: hypothetical protein R2852_00050 [Bacteroidia bacterium]
MIINAEIIILNTDHRKREILTSAFMLHSKNTLDALNEMKGLVADMNASKVIKLFLYENWIDEEYNENLKQKFIPNDLKTDKYLINYGQDFGKYYLGYLSVDFINKTHWIPVEPGDKIDNLKAIGDALFSQNKESRRIIIMNVTTPDDLKVKRM